MQYIGFQLGREQKLSTAELLAVFPDAKVVFYTNSILVLENISADEVKEKFHTIGGTIKVFEANFFANIEEIYEEILNYAKKIEEGKFKYSINVFGEKSLKLENVLKKTKNLFKSKDISAKYFNKNDGKNLTSGQIIGNKILQKGFDFNILNLNGVFYFGKTFLIQDIDAYSKRDFSKNRDMQVGMLPPKLCQIMLNFATKGNYKNISIFDPFVGLGTILIEALNSGANKVFGSDLNQKMIEETNKNLTDFIKINNLKNIEFKTEKLNAKFINESSFLNSDFIVTEGYLGEIMTHKNISLDRINKQKESLILIYKAFFENLSKSNFSGKIVICFPFWELDKKYIFLSEVLEIINQYSIIEDLGQNLVSKTGSLLYKREKQLVGREIYCLRMK